MITLSVGGSDRKISSRTDVDEVWINNQIGGRRAEGQPVCVRIRIESGSLNISLSSAGCPPGQAGRRARPDEQRIIDLWRDRGLGNADFQGGHLISFLHQLMRIIE